MDTEPFGELDPMDRVNGSEPEGAPPRCTHQALDGVLVYRLAGDLDLNCDALALDAPLTGFRAVIVDLADVGFFGSAALNALVGLRRRATEAGLEVHLCAVPAMVSNILDITRTGTLFPTHEDVDATLLCLT